MKTESPLIKKTSPKRYGFAMFGTSIPINMFKSYAAAYYVQTLSAITMEDFALISLIYAFVDAIDNPVYGFLSDNTRTKWGRRRPWLLIGTPLLVLFFVLFYSAPASLYSEKNKIFIYLLLMYILTGTLDSLVNANYGSLFPELFKKDDERAKVNGFRQICQLVAMAISIVLTPMVAGAIGYRLTAIIYGILALAVMMFCFMGCHEPQIVEEETEKPKLIPGIIALVTNPRFWIFGFAGAFYSASFSLISQALPFYVKYTLGLDGTMNTVLLAIVFGVALIGVIVWLNLARKMPIMTIWKIGFAVMALGFLPLFFVKSFGAAVPIAAFIGVGVAACLTSMDCIGAKIVDDDYRKHGIKREGIINSLMGVMNRLNGLYISLAFLVVSRVFGFENGENPGANPDLASRVLLCVFPGVAMVLAFVFALILKFPKGKENE